MASQERGQGPTRGLEGVRVLDLSDPKGALCGKFLADMGADVVRVEPPGGDPTRRLPPLAQDGAGPESLLFWYFNTNKRSVALDLTDPKDRERFLRLVASAHVLLEGHQPGFLASLGLSDDVLLKANPRLVLTSVTGFGQTGPFRDWRSSDIVAWAMGGLMGISGDPNREPLTAPALQASQVAGVWSLISTLAAILRLGATGQGARVDISAQEAVLDISESGHLFYIYEKRNIGRTSGDHPLACPFSNYETTDGYAFIGLANRRQWQSILAWMAESVSVDDLQDPTLNDIPYRIANRPKINAVVERWARRLTGAELMVEGARRGIPNAPIRRMPEVADDDHLAARGYFVPVPDPRPDHQGRSYRYPGLPFRGKEGLLRTASTPAPRPGAHTEEVTTEWDQRPAPPVPAAVPGGRLPLEGVKVVELCWLIAGPTFGRVLADLGATVIKVEPREIGDPWRMSLPFAGGEPNVNRSGAFAEVNRNKLAISLDLKRPRGKELMLGLARWADVFLENFTAGTMERLGLGYDMLSQANPRLILASVCGYGQWGPRWTWPSFHPTSAALSGLIYLFAYDSTRPMGFTTSYMDYMTGFMGAMAVLEALLRRARTGKGDHLDVSQLESAVCLVGLELLQWEVNKVAPEPEGNRSGALGALLQGCYAARGDDSWIVVTAPDQASLGAIARVVGLSVSGSNHLAPQDVEAALRTWAGKRDAWEAVHALQGVGVPSGVVSYGSDLLERDEHLKARGVFRTIEHPEMGTASLATSPLVLDGERLPVRSPAPLISEHNEYVLRQVLGLTEEEYLDCVIQEVV